MACNGREDDAYHDDIPVDKDFCPIGAEVYQYLALVSLVSGIFCVASCIVNIVLRRRRSKENCATYHMWILVHWAFAGVLRVGRWFTDGLWHNPAFWIGFWAGAVAYGAAVDRLMFLNGDRAMRFTHALNPTKVRMWNRFLSRVTRVADCLVTVTGIGLCIGSLLTLTGGQQHVLLACGLSGLILFTSILLLLSCVVVYEVHKNICSLPDNAPARILHRLRSHRSILTFGAILMMMLTSLGIHILISPQWLQLAGFYIVYVYLLCVDVMWHCQMAAELYGHWRFMRHRSGRDEDMSSKIHVTDLVASGVQALRSVRETSEDGPSCLPSLPAPTHHESQIPPVWDRGVSLHLLLRLVDEFEVKDLTTSEVCERIIKPQTASARCSFWEAVYAGGPSSRATLIGKPACMVSHAWQYKFTTLVAIIQRYCDQTKANPNTTYFFLDMISMNQHQLADVGGPDVRGHMAMPKDEDPLAQAIANKQDLHKVLLNALTNSVVSASKVLLALEPWDQPLLLKRSWCLYEIWVAMKGNSKLVMAMSKDSEESFFESLLEHRSKMEDLIRNVDARMASATKECDRIMILNAIDEIGIDVFNRHVQQGLHQSLNMVAMQRWMAATSTK